MLFENKINILSVNDARLVSLKYILMRKLVPIRILEKLKRLFIGQGVYITKEFDRTQSIFVHIPKAAGTSVSKAFYGSRQGHHTALAYKMADPARFEKYFKYSIVRNPYSRLYSTYNYLLNSPHTEDSEWAKENIASYLDFNDFVCRWVNEENIMRWKHFLPQVFFVCDTDENLIVDDIGKIEEIDDIFSKVSKRLGYAGSLPQENKMGSSKYAYRSSYTNESIAIVARVYEADLRLFKYAF